MTSQRTVNQGDEIPIQVQLESSIELLDSSSGVGGSRTSKVKGKRNNENWNNLMHVEHNTDPAFNKDKEVSSLKLDDHSLLLFDQD